jgi:amidohydrolase
MPRLTDAIAAIHDELLALRHDLHRHPEPGFEETRTQARLREVLRAAGLAPRDCAGTGLVADIAPAGGGPAAHAPAGGGPAAHAPAGSGTAAPAPAGGGEHPAGHDRRPAAIALRADIDALRMTEANPDLPHRSERPGVAHLCGHDGHMTMLIGAARLLAAATARLPGTVRLLFQPAEEGPGGAPVMIREGALDGIDEVYGCHNWPRFDLGTLHAIAGPTMARVAMITVRVEGKGGHASQPHLAIDPILAASHVVTALQSIVSRTIHCRHAAVVSITMISGGEVHNVIPDTVDLTGTIRVLDEDDYGTVESRVRVIAEQTAAAFGARAECTFERMYPVLVNDAEATGHVLRVGRSVFGEANVSGADLPILASEDFAYYTRERPGCFFFLGGAEPGRTNAMCHATDYEFNDRLIDQGVAMWVRLVEDRLGVRLYD